MEKKEVKNSYLYDLMIQEQEQEKKDRLEVKVEALNKELKEIAQRAYQTARNAKLKEYEERVRRTGITDEEMRVIEAERNDFECNPSKYGVEYANCPIVDEADKKRSMQIVELLSDTSKISVDDYEMTDEQFIEHMKGFAERNTK